MISDQFVEKYDCSIWVSGDERLIELTQNQIKKFEDANEGIAINATISNVSEGEAATLMESNVYSGADIFCFAQDQTMKLIYAGALSKLEDKASAFVKENNNKSSISAATFYDSLFAYPLTSDNGYFMYYDKSIIPEEHLGSLEAIIADCEAAQRMFSFNLESAAWYNASFFFATGCVSNWYTNSNGEFFAVDDTFNSDEGVVALKGMQKLLKSPCYVDSSSAFDFGGTIPSAVVVSGIWDAMTAQSILGENYGAAPLPKFTVNGNEYQLGSFSGNRLMGVKPQADVKKSAVLHKLAQFLTSEQCQLERFEIAEWTPSNVKAAASEVVTSNIALKALLAQNQYAIPQGQIHGAWWDISKTYATAARKATTDEELKAALVSYEKAIKGLFSMSSDEKESFTVIGNLLGDCWSKDIEMEQRPEGTWMTKQAILLEEGQEFRVRQGKSWDVSYGSGESNYVVSAEEAGYRFIKLVVEGSTGTVTVEKYSPYYSYSAIGTLGDSCWDKDFYLTQIDEKTYISDPIKCAAWQEFKIRYATSWDINYGENGVMNGNNITIETAGTYSIKLTIDSDTIDIELVKIS